MSVRLIFTAIVCCLQVLEMSGDMYMVNDCVSEWEEDQENSSSSDDLQKLYMQDIHRQETCKHRRTFYQ